MLLVISIYVLAFGLSFMRYPRFTEPETHMFHLHFIRPLFSLEC